MRSCIDRLKKGDMVIYHDRGGNPGYNCQFIFDHFYNLGYAEARIRYAIGKPRSYKEDVLYDLDAMVVTKIFKLR